MALHLNVSSGLGQEYSWSHDGPIVRVGRNPECELRMSSDAHQTVSWEHAKIELRPGGAFVSDLGSSNGTYLNGRRIDARTLLRPGDVISLGQEGIQLTAVQIEPPNSSPAAGIGARGTAIASASPGGPSGPPPRVPVVQQNGPLAPAPTAASGTRQMVIAMQQRGRMRWFAAAAGATAVALVIFVMIYFQSQRIGTVSIELDERNREIEARKREADERLDALAMQTAKQFEDTNKKIAAITEADAANIHRRFAEAVYLVAVRVPGGAVQPVGTAFAVSPLGVFATNAHVAKFVQELLAKKINVLLISQRGIKQLRVTAAECHPLYQPTEQVGYHTPDLAVLRAQLPLGQSLGCVVQLAKDSDLQELRVGSPLCYIGFPAFLDSDYSSLAEVNSRTYQGRLNRLLTLDEKSGEFSNNQLIEHDMYSWGGASGSPIFNARGKVVAVHFSASPVDHEIKLGDAEKSIKIKFASPSPASSKWGMRVDLLRELYSP